jgi:hypothetical protein
MLGRFAYLGASAALRPRRRLRGASISGREGVSAAPVELIFPESGGMGMMIVSSLAAPCARLL